MRGVVRWDVAKFNKIEPGATEFIDVCSFEDVHDEDSVEYIKNKYDIKDKYNIEIEVRAKNEMTVFACFVYMPSSNLKIIPSKPKKSFNSFLDA
jgi:hypothetical protein